MREHRSDLAILYPAFCDYQFQVLSGCTSDYSSEQALPLVFVFVFFFFPCTVQTYLFYATLRGDVYYKSAQVSQNGIKAE